MSITSGSRARIDDRGRWRVPKAMLVANLRRRLASGRLKVADGLREGPALLRELVDFRVSITASANETFAASSGGHDDLVLAVAIAVWGVRVG